jgi:hypothetical protein
MAILHISDAARNACVNAVVALIDAASGAGYIEYYSGTMAATPATAISDQLLLGTTEFSTTSFVGASSGSATANAISSGTGVANPGTTCTWARIYDGNGVVILDVDVATSGATINLSNTEILLGSTITVTSGTLAMPSGV